MIRIKAYIFTALFLISYVAEAVPNQPAEQHSRIVEAVHQPRQWRKTSRASDDARIHLSIGLRHNSTDELEKRLDEVSDPFSALYGRHLTASEISQDVLRVSSESVEATRLWLQQNGIGESELTESREWLSASIPVRQVEKLLQCKYYEFVHRQHGDTLVRTLEWSIPRHLKDHIDVIQPTNAFLRMAPQSRHGGVPPPDWETEGRVPTYDELAEEDLIDRGHLDVPQLEDLDGNYTLEAACNRLAVSATCLRVMYGTYNYKPKSTDKNRLGVVNFLGNNNNRSDIAKYLSTHRPDAAKAGAAEAFNVTLIAGAEDQQTPNTEEQLKSGMGREGALDVETLIGVGWPTPLEAWNVGSKPPFKSSINKVKNTNEPYLQWLQHVLAQDNLPQVISISYADEEQTVPLSYARRVCEGFAQLGLRGVSVIVASGDDGVGPEDGCFSNDGENKPRFLPTFPASCPYVTAVGGTRHLNPVVTGFDVRGGYITGGGFSDHFRRPRYQDAVVEPYLQSLNGTYKGLYNPHGRGIPDVSAHSYHHLTVWNGVSHLVDGTSASAPLFAAIISLVNDDLIANDNPPLGFLNPWLYKTAAQSGFRDVTMGSNRGCGTDGFPAAEGWDAATGLGVPWFPHLRKLAALNKFRFQRPWYLDDV